MLLARIPLHAYQTNRLPFSTLQLATKVSFGFIHFECHSLFPTLCTSLPKYTRRTWQQEFLPHGRKINFSQKTLEENYEKLATVLGWIDRQGK